MDRETYDPCIDCCIFHAKMPTFVGFITEDPNNEFNIGINVGMIDFTRVTMIPTFIVYLKDEMDMEWAATRFGIKREFPCIVSWSEGKLFSQCTSSDPPLFGGILGISYMLSDMLNYISLTDVRAHRLKQYYEDLKKIEDQGGDINGGDGREATSRFVQTSCNETGIFRCRYP